MRNFSDFDATFSKKRILLENTNRKYYELMKNVFMVALFSALCLPLSAQKREHVAERETLPTLLKKNELKVNLPVTIFALFPEISYERVLNPDVSIGGAVGCSLDGGESYLNTFQFSPYARWFFGGSRKSMEKSASGFFIELNGAVLSSVNDNSEEYYYVNSAVTRVETNRNLLGAGLGVAIGWKYLNRSNWVGEILLGGGRDFINDGAYPRFGISIGKRF